MSSAIWVLPQLRPQSQFMPMQEPERFARQRDLPIERLRIFRLVRGWFRPRRQPAGIVYFGKRRQFAAIGTAIYRVSR